MTESQPEDPRDALIREQAALLEVQAGQIAALPALVAELGAAGSGPQGRCQEFRELLEAAEQR